MAVLLPDNAQLTLTDIEPAPKSRAVRIFEHAGNTFVATLLVMFFIGCLFAPGDDLDGILRFWMELLGGAR